MAEKNGEDNGKRPVSPHGEVNRPAEPEGLDLAAGPAHGRAERREQGSDSLPSGSTQETTHRREENPFSFKRFLNQDRGVRRKEYSTDGTPILHSSSEMSSVLPDFVQDHLVVEQCYLSSSPAHHGTLPFDLPLPAEDRADSAVPQSLPDFLSDGPIRSQRGETENSPYLVSSKASNGLSSPAGSAPRNDIERLQRELDSLRRQVSERNRRVEILEAEVALLHSQDARETSSLEQALKQVENNLRQSSKRLATAEETVAKLKSENKYLRAELEIYREGGAGASSSTGSTGGGYVRARDQRLAGDLRGAASAAEAHLRSLMSGINSLRMVAAVLEDRIDLQEYDDCDDFASGPAL